MSEQSSARPLTELRVSGQLMVLEPGTYCAFAGPGSPVADASTGLPAIRLAAAPGAGAETGAGVVTIAGFGDAGWLSGGSDAALIRIAGGPGRVLVTVYQDADPRGDAPKLQVLRVSGAPAVAAAAAPPAASPALPLEAMAHVYGRGDIGGRFGDWIGERGSRRWIEGFALQAQRLNEPGAMEYQAVLGRGWLSPWVEAGQFCGSRGMSLPILGLHVRLRGAAAAAFDVAVSASFVDGTAIGPVRDQPAEAPSLAALEAFHVMLEPKSDAAGEGAAKPGDAVDGPAGMRRR